MKMIQTNYANTDFELKSHSPFETLYRELIAKCNLMQYELGGDGIWHAGFELMHDEDSVERDAEKDILTFIEIISALSTTAKDEFHASYLREFNIGFDCWDSW